MTFEASNTEPPPTDKITSTACSFTNFCPSRIDVTLGLGAIPDSSITFKSDNAAKTRSYKPDFLIDPPP